MSSYHYSLIALALLINLSPAHALNVNKSPLPPLQQEFLLDYGQWHEQHLDASTQTRPPRPSQDITQVKLHLHLQYLLCHGQFDPAEKTRREFYAVLVYMLKLNEAIAYSSVDALEYWTHSEHFLEYRPSLFLDVLVELKWPVRTDLLRSAIKKLESLLPTNKKDMIDCAAGRPLGKLLQLLAYQDKIKAQSEIEKYRRSPDPYLSYAAQLAALELRHRPKPTLNELVRKHWQVHSARDLAELSHPQRLIAECIAAHDGALEGHFVDWMSAAKIRETAQYWKAKGFPLHAAALLQFLSADQQHISQDAAQIYKARDNYRNIEKRGPLYIVAEDLINSARLLTRP